MYSRKSIQWKALIVSIIISMGTGFLAGLFTRDGIALYRTLNQPPFAPPGWTFPVVWPILYALMGISAYLVFVSDSKYRKPTLILYAVQLLMNFFWPFLFFRLQAFFWSVIWISCLWFAIEAMIFLFFACRKSVGFLQIPYFLWGSLAGYLTLGVWLLNR